MIEQRYGTRDMSHFGGLATRLPVLAVCMIFVCMASVGLPMLNGFVGEYLSLSGMFARHPAYAIVGATGVVLGAWYLLTLIQRIFFGPVREPRPEGASAPDLRPRELAIAIPLMALCLAIGLYPKPLTDLIQPDVHRVVRLYDFSPVTPQVASTETGEGSGGR
jgi:NADH-quinone oxidoreductase subunit M